MKNALWMGATVYIVPFIVAALVSSVTGGTAVSPSPVGGLIGLVVTIVILVLLSLKYLKSVAPNTKEGFIFGIVVGIVGLIIDTIIVIVSDAARPLGNLMNPLFWLAIVIIVVIATLVGFFKGKKTKSKQK